LKREHPSSLTNSVRQALAQIAHAQSRAGVAVFGDAAGSERGAALLNFPQLNTGDLEKIVHTHRLVDRKSTADTVGLSDLSLQTASLIIPRNKNSSGTLIQTIPFIWNEIVDVLRKDWSQAYTLPAEKFEELVAGAFHKDGYDEVTLTPRSGDHGRDIIAIKRGVGCVKIIGSVKRYAPHRLVTYDDVRALLGVLAGEQDSSKGIIVTTSNFPKGLPHDPFIGPFLPTRLELMGGEDLRRWLTDLRLKATFGPDYSPQSIAACHRELKLRRRAVRDRDRNR
jgi:restriction system protein